MRFMAIAAACWVLGSPGEGAILRTDPVEGGFLEKGARATGVAGGVSLGTLAFGGTVKRDLAVLQVQYGVVVSDVLAEDRVFGGRLLLAGDFLFAQEYRPDSGVLFGATPLVRYVFETEGRWKPFLEGGFGLVLTDIGGPNLSGKLQLSPQGGSGFYLVLKPDIAFTAQYRMTHYSNGGRRSPNSGMNQHVFLLGLTRFY